MIGAMPAVAVRHERRRQEKRGSGGGGGVGCGGGTCIISGGGGHSHHGHGMGLCSRPSQLYVGGGVWAPTHSPCSASPSPGGHYSPDVDRLPEYYVCGKVSALQLVVGSLLLGAIVLVVGLVQLTPGADAADHRFYLMGAGTSLLTLGLVLTGVRCCCIHCPRKSSQVIVEPPTGVSSIDMLVKEGVATSPSELDELIKGNDQHNNHHVHDSQQDSRHSSHRNSRESDNFTDTNQLHNEHNSQEHRNNQNQNHTGHHNHHPHHHNDHLDKYHQLTNIEENHHENNHTIPSQTNGIAPNLQHCCIDMMGNEDGDKP